MTPRKLDWAVATVGARWMRAKPWRRWLLRRLWPGLAEGLDLLEHWVRERGPL